MTRYDIRLRIVYKYDTAASAGRHVARLLPAELPGEQRVVASTLDVSPRPAEWTTRVDFFGNTVSEVAFAGPHERIGFEVRAVVDVSEAGPQLDVSPRLETLAHEIAGARRLDARSPHHFTGPSQRAPIDPAVTAFAREAAPESASAFAAVVAVGAAVHAEMRFDTAATTVDTTMIDAFENRHGVCQDFSHVMIAALRGIGVPAGYVSGFLRTDPPPGQPRLEGADAMHAWVMAWCGSELGWVEYDPTNGVFAGSDHIVIARGRDYADVSPVRGTMRTSGDHTSVQQVDVVPMSGGG